LAVAAEGTLLERMDMPDESNYRLEPDVYRVTESVLNYLRKMLNVRQGSVATLPDYGMPDLNDLYMQYPDPVLALRRIIKELIEKYEPRLRHVIVRYVPDEDDPLSHRFDITAHLVVDNETAPLRFETVVGDTGRIQVRG
jgi:type VI secretion system protein